MIWFWKRNDANRRFDAMDWEIFFGDYKIRQQNLVRLKSIRNACVETHSVYSERIEPI